MREHRATGEQKEALITGTFNLSDTDGKAFAKTATINVSP
jgi:hypothetical protein